MLHDLDALWKEFPSALGYEKVMWNAVNCSEGIYAGTDMHALLHLCAYMKHKICVFKQESCHSNLSPVSRNMNFFPSSEIFLLLTLNHLELFCLVFKHRAFSYYVSVI